MPGTRRAFRFGVVGERIRSKDQLVAEARRAEALGYATLLLRDPSSANRSVTDDHRAAAERAAVERGWGAAAAEQVLEMPSVLVGSIDRITEQLLARRDRHGFSYLVVSDEDMEAFAPVVDHLAGQ